MYAGLESGMLQRARTSMVMRKSESTLGKFGHDVVHVHLGKLRCRDAENGRQVLHHEAFSRGRRPVGENRKWFPAHRWLYLVQLFPKAGKELESVHAKFQHCLFFQVHWKKVGSDCCGEAGE